MDDLVRSDPDQELDNRWIMFIAKCLITMLHECLIPSSMAIRLVIRAQTRRDILHVWVIWTITKSSKKPLKMVQNVKLTNDVKRFV